MKHKIAKFSSATNEHYTPPEIVERARAVLGGFDLDPASCAKANTVVRARRIFTAATNGFARAWSGRVFLNPPGGTCDVDGVTLEKGEFGHGWIRPDGKPVETPTSSQRAWWFKLAAEHAAKRVDSAIFVCFSVELLQTTQAAMNEDIPIPFDFPICFPRARVDYLRDVHGKLTRGGAPPHASCIVFLPPHEVDGDDTATTLTERFLAEFSSLGRVVLP